MQLIDVCEENERFIKKEFPNLYRAAKARKINSAIHLYLQIPLDDEKLKNEREKLWNVIKANRKEILTNVKVRLKTRIAIVFSYFGESKFKRIYIRLKHFEKKQI